MKKEEVEKIAKEVFKKVPDAEKAYITSDGQGFIKKNSAQLHKNSNPKGKKLELFEVVNPSKVVSIAADTAAKPSGNATKVTPGKKANPEDRSPDDPESEKQKAADQKAQADAKAKAETKATKKKAPAGKKSTPTKAKQEPGQEQAKK